jgi:phage tail-like protein
MHVESKVRMPATGSRNNAYAAAHFGLELDKKEDVALFRSIEGGNVKVDVMTYQNGPNYDRYRQLGKPKFEDIKLQVGMAMSEPFYKWIKDFFLGKATRKDGAIIAADFYYKERARREFTNGIIRELTFPKLDGQDKNPAYMSIGIAVENVVFQPGNGHVIKPGEGFDAQKLWTSCNFRFELSGFEDFCRRVTKIDSFTIKQNIAEHHVGGQLAPIKVCTAIDFPHIAFYLPEPDSHAFVDHFTNEKNLNIKNEIDASSPLHGSIVTFDNEDKKLFTIQFTGSDIHTVTPDKSDSGSEEVKQVKIEIYTEKMEFAWH